MRARAIGGPYDGSTCRDLPEPFKAVVLYPNSRAREGIAWSDFLGEPLPKGAAIYDLHERDGDDLTYRHHQLNLGGGPRTRDKELVHT